MNFLEGKDFVTLKGIPRENLELLFDVTRRMEEVVEQRSRLDLLRDKVLGLAFFQVSTRTKTSFESAMVRLGGAVVGFSDPKTTRAGDYYAESLYDVMRMMESYSDVIVIRHPEDFAPFEAAEAVAVPVINAGDGYNEHPTQALIDIYTIQREKGRVDGLKIALVGDMNMRVLHSLPLALAQYDTRVFLISPVDRRMPEKWASALAEAGLRFEQYETLDALLPELDVIYLMGTLTPSYSQGRTDTQKEKTRTPEPYVIDRHKLAKASPGLIVLHPLPRADELPREVDNLPGAKYFVQAHHGVAIRMALLSLIFGRGI
jgi:aspartate carbamoyltransferase catalytic subunit